MAERKSKTIIEVMACTIYLSNRSPSIIVWGKTPQEAWSEIKPSISYLTTFRIVARVNILDERRAKLENKSEKFIYVSHDLS